MTTHDRAHAAQPHTGVDALQAAIEIMRMLSRPARPLPGLRSQVAGIDSPTIRSNVRQRVAKGCASKCGDCCWRALVPLPAHERLAAALQRHAQTYFGGTIRAQGDPLYTDARLCAEAGIPTVLYGAGPRTLIESNAKRTDERLVLEDLRRATQVVASTLFDLLNGT